MKKKVAAFFLFALAVSSHSQSGTLKAEGIERTKIGVSSQSLIKSIGEEKGLGDNEAHFVMDGNNKEEVAALCKKALFIAKRYLATFEKYFATHQKAFGKNKKHNKKTLFSKGEMFSAKNTLSEEGGVKAVAPIKIELSRKAQRLVQKTLVIQVQFLADEQGFIDKKSVTLESVSFIPTAVKNEVIDQITKTALFEFEDKEKTGKGELEGQKMAGKGHESPLQGFEKAARFDKKANEGFGSEENTLIIKKRLKYRMVCTIIK